LFTDEPLQIFRWTWHIKEIIAPKEIRIRGWRDREI